MRTSNPVLNEKRFLDYQPGTGTTRSGEVMTIDGTINKTLILGLLLICTALFTWKAYLGGANIQGYMMGGAIGGLIVALITIFKSEWAHITAPIYALLEGFFVGGLSAMMEAAFPGIVLQAVALTFGVMFMMLAAYKSGTIRATPAFRKGIIAATGAIFIVYLVSWIAGLAFGTSIPFIHEGGIIGIGFSLFVVVIAALNFILDFDFIEKASASGADKKMEWMGAFSLMLTLVWLYIEILRLLSKLRE